MIEYQYLTLHFKIQEKRNHRSSRNMTLFPFKRIVLMFINLDLYVQ